MQDAASQEDVGRRLRHSAFFERARKAPAPTESTFVCLPGQYANSCSVNAGEVQACEVDGVVENLSVCEDADSGEEGMVPGTGLEPARPCGHWLLRPARLPIPPSRRDA